MTNAARATHAFLVAVCLLPTAVVAQDIGARRIIVLARDADDTRVPIVREAVGFWNRTLADLDLAVRVAVDAVLVDPPSARALEYFARQVSQRGGRFPRGVAGPQPPMELTDLAADIVVLLSRQPLMPFAWPLIGSPGYLVAIRAVESRPPRDDKVLKNVVAHELGHTLGLTHNRATATLMCGPCSSAAAEDNPQEWLPLTANDRARLRELHPAAKSATAR